MRDKIQSFEKYQEDTYRKWRKSILITGFIISVFILAIEIYMYIILKTEENILGFGYIVIRIITPSILNFGSFLIAIIIQYNKNISMSTKNFFSTFPFFMVCSVLAIFHSYFQILLISPAFCIFLCSIFGDTKILKLNAALTVPSFIIAIITFFLDENTGENYYKFLTVITAVAIIASIFALSNIILRSQAEKIEYIYKNYEKQTMLIEELRIDPLTKLYNRIALQEALTSIISRAKTDNVKSLLVMLDLDFFKKINDKYGHICGDQVLTILADIIRSRMETTRKSFRFGGEEFVLLFEDTDRDAVTDIVNLIRQDYAATRFSFAEDKSFTFSAGIAEVCKDDDASKWIERADKALYYAKTHGRNQIKFSE